MKPKKFLTAISVVACAAGGIAFATPAGAASESVVVTLRSANQTNFNQLLGECFQPIAGQKCAVGATTSSTRTIGTSFGVTRAFVAASIGISNGASESVSVTCELTATSNRHHLVAHPVGTQIFYKIKKGNQTSGTLMAFEPKKNAFACFAYDN